MLHTTVSADSAPAVGKSRQFIPALPGYIPVYIRPGDTPLEDINLDLAEAFDSYAQKQGRLIYGRAIPSGPSGGQIHVQIRTPVASANENSLNFEEKLTLEGHNAETTSPNLRDAPQHIQKIRRN